MGGSHMAPPGQGMNEYTQVFLADFSMQPSTKGDL